MECSIEKTIEITTEVNWEQTLERDSGKAVTVANGDEHSWEIGSETEIKSGFKIDIEGGGDAEVKPGAPMSGGGMGGEGEFKFTANKEFEWTQHITAGGGGTSSHSDEVATETVNIKGSGIANSKGKADSITCSASIEVEPNSLVDYDIVQQVVNETYRTFTDIKFTKCSFYYQSEEEKSLGIDDTEHFIYQYNVPGILITKKAEKCSVRFYRSDPINPSSLKCDEAQKRFGYYNFGTYIPMCVPNSGGGYDWNPCQCDYGDGWTNAKCNCVDKTSGILIEGKAQIIYGNQDW
eukprot:CAMPEP_0114655910 /NCGR_PEP_ID=MMETSP0191-20121206/11588_1 /TAXON_ID=126664 /ORGANISM="Sorites sp." /LENGTH=292 /DNA_ID=CAMNT_0001872141 /DNA_START=4091 /DNA_END=4966 /DNA_ORIENTATION=+